MESGEAGMRTFGDLYVEVTNLFPNATIGTDNDGQLIVYTNLIETSDGTIEEME